jgi:hypothetical protein
MRVTWTNRKTWTALLIPGLLGLSVRGIAAAEWQVERVDQSGAGQFTSMKIDKDGNIHLAYIPDVDGHPLKYAYWDHSLKRWFSMIVTNVASFCTLVLDSKQHPHISFADHGTGLGTKIRHAYWDGTQWNVQPIANPGAGVIGYYTSIGLDAQDNPFLSYYDYTDHAFNSLLRLRTVFWKGYYWEMRVADSEMGSGKFNSLAVDSSGHPHIAYANVRYESSSLRYATWNGNNWKTEIIEGESGPTPILSVNMVLDKEDKPHISYTDVERKLVKYATWRGGKWESQVVDKIQQEALVDRNGIALDNQGNPYVSYYDNRIGVLKVAFRNKGKWYAEVVDGNFAGFTSSLVIDRDTIWVSYSDTSDQAVKVAHRSLQVISSENKPGTIATSISNVN